MSEWQPIATAPKDGTWILAYAPDGEWARISWGKNRSDEIVWCSARYWWNPRSEHKFTHWMPLPAPPHSLTAEHSA